MTMLPAVLEALNAAKNQVLKLAQSSMPESQFRAFRGLFLDVFGRDGLERDLDRILGEYQQRNGTETGRPIQARKEVPHD